MISIDRNSQKVIRFTFSDYTELARPTVLGIRSFPITGLAQLPLAERDLVVKLLNSSDVKRWLDVSIVQDLPDSPFTMIHLQQPPTELAGEIFEMA